MKRINSFVQMSFTVAALTMFTSRLPAQHPEPCCSKKPVYETPATNFLMLAGQVAAATLHAEGGTGNFDKVFPGPIPNQDLVIWNISTPPAPNTDWAPKDFYYSDPRWDYNHLGDVFGLTIDDQGNIYVAATTIYYKAYGEVARVGSVADPKLSFNEKHGVIYKIANGTGLPTQFAHLPNPNGAGLGNVTFDCVHKKFYASNFDDGLIYQLDLNGNILNTWDHGQERSTAHDASGAGFLLANIPSTAGGQTRDNQGYALLGRRPWAVRVYQGHSLDPQGSSRLFYSIWSMDSIENSYHGVSSAFPNQIWSVALDTTGKFVPNTLRFEVTLPLLNHVSAPWNNPVADLTFGSAEEMYVAERSMGSLGFGNYVSSIDSHSRVLEFVPELKAGIAYVGHTPPYYLDWSLMAVPTYQVGCYASPSVGYRANAAGGVDFDLTPGAKYPLWTTGNKLHDGNSPYFDFVWGLQGFPWNGGKVENSILIDLNDTTASRSEAENQVGAVRIPCPAVINGGSTQPQM